MKARVLGPLASLATVILVWLFSVLPAMAQTHQGLTSPSGTMMPSTANLPWPILLLQLLSAISATAAASLIVVVGRRLSRILLHSDRETQKIQPALAALQDKFGNLKQAVHQSQNFIEERGKRDNQPGGSSLQPASSHSSVSRKDVTEILEQRVNRLENEVKLQAKEILRAVAALSSELRPPKSDGLDHLRHILEGTLDQSDPVVAEAIGLRTVAERIQKQSVRDDNFLDLAFKHVFTPLVVPLASRPLTSEAGGLRADLIRSIEQTRQWVALELLTRQKIQPMNVVEGSTLFDRELHTSARGSEVLTNKSEAHGKVAEVLRPGFTEAGDQRRVVRKAEVRVYRQHSQPPTLPAGKDLAREPNGDPGALSVIKERIKNKRLMAPDLKRPDWEELARDLTELKNLLESSSPDDDAVLVCTETLSALNAKIVDPAIDSPREPAHEFEGPINGTVAKVLRFGLSVGGRLMVAPRVRLG